MHATTGFHFPKPVVFPHQFGERRILDEALAVDPRRRLDQLAAPIEKLVAEFDDPQIRPRIGADPQDFRGDRLGTE